MKRRIFATAAILSSLLTSNAFSAPSDMAYATTFGKLSKTTYDNQYVAFKTQEHLEHYLHSFGYISQFLILSDRSSAAGEYETLDYIVPSQSVRFQATFLASTYSAGGFTNEKSEPDLIDKLSKKFNATIRSKDSDWSWDSTDNRLREPQIIHLKKNYSYLSRNGLEQNIAVYRNMIYNCKPPKRDEISLSGNSEQIDYQLLGQSSEPMCTNEDKLSASAFSMEYYQIGDANVLRGEAILEAREILDKYPNDVTAAMREIGSLENNTANALYAELRLPNVTGEEIYHIQKLVEAKISGYAEALHPKSDISVKTSVTKVENGEYFINLNVLNYFGYKESAQTFSKSAKIVVYIDGDEIPVGFNHYMLSVNQNRNAYILGNMGLVPVENVVDALNREISCNASPEASDYINSLRDIDPTIVVDSGPTSCSKEN